MTGPRRTHKKKELVISPKKKEDKKKPQKKKVAVVVGRAYTLEELGALISTLTGDNTDREIHGVEEVAENQAAIMEAASKVPDVEASDIVDLVTEAVIKNEQEMLARFEKERKQNALRFIAKTESIPAEIRQKAVEILERIKPPEFQEAKMPEAKAPASEQTEYTPQQVKALVRALESKIPQLRVPAAIKFITDYPKIAQTVTEMPLLTVTQVTTKAVEIIKQDTDKVINTMSRKGMVPALNFLSSLGQVPLDIRNKAFKAAEKVATRMPGYEPELKVVDVKDIKIQKSYSPMELSALLDGLGSVERVRVVRAAIEFLKNYDIIIEAVSKAPEITVTQITDLAVKAIESNLGTVLRTLEKTADEASLTFLSNSSRVSDKVKKKAQAALMRVMIAKKKMKAPFLKQAIDSQDKD